MIKVQNFLPWYNKDMLFILFYLNKNLALIPLHRMAKRFACFID